MTRLRLPPTLLSLTLATTVQAAAAAGPGLGIGAEAGSKPALSVQYQTTRQSAYHMTARYGDGTAGFSADYQRLAPPAFRGNGWVVAAYAGLGLDGEGDRDADAERYKLRLPLGVQYDVDALRLSVFAEAAGLVGPLPTTQMAGTVAGGLRARF